MVDGGYTLCDFLRGSESLAFQVTLGGKSKQVPLAPGLLGIFAAWVEDAGKKLTKPQTPNGTEVEEGDTIITNTDSDGLGHWEPVNLAFLQKPAETSQEELLKTGTGEAANRLKNDSCAKFFGGKDKGLKALNSLNFSVDSSMPENGHPQAQIQGNNVSVNPKGGLLTPDTVGHTYLLVERTKSGVNILKLTLSGAEARAFGQLHEAAHKAKRFGSTDNDLAPQRLMNGYENNFKIWKACFGDTPTQPWKGQPKLIP